jgi:hypothetical protein
MWKKATLLTFTALTLLSQRAHAAVDASLPAGGGLGALAVHVDLPNRTVLRESCPREPCAIRPESLSVPIGLERERLPDASEVTLEVFDLGAGKKAIHVRVPSRDAKEALDPAWEGLFVAGTEPLFVGLTGYVRGEPGERSGVVLRRLSDGSKDVVALGEVQEELRICGEGATVLRPRGLDATTLHWRGATLPGRLPAERRERAIRVVAGSRAGAPADPPLAPLLRAEGASTALGNPASLADGDPETTWSEARPGQGQGEFVLFHAPQEIPITRFAIAVAPKTPKPEGAAPRNFFLATDRALYEVLMPEDAWAHPGAAYDVALPEPVTTSCVALVLGDAYSDGKAKPEVTLAELYAYSGFDTPGADFDHVALALANGGARAEAASGVLKRAGTAGLRAVAVAFPKLDAAGRALAIDVAASAQDCKASSRLLSAALADSDEIVREKAKTKLQEPHCGQEAVPELIASLDVPDRRVPVAELLASVAPRQALEPLANELGKGSAKERARLRSAFAHADEAAPPAELIALLSQEREPGARIELLRASASRLGDAKVAAEGALHQLLEMRPDATARYLLASPIAALAEAGDGQAEEWLVGLLEHDDSAPVRTRAAELAGASARTRAALPGAETDAEPRVREAALKTAGASRVEIAEPGAISALKKDPWTFVRAAAVGALASLPASKAADEALGHAVNDRVPRIRAASIAALSVHAAGTYADVIRDRLEDKHEDSDVRVAAAHAAGALCDAGSVNDLVEYADRGAFSPDASDVALGLAATEALGDLRPVDLANRLKHLRSNGARPDARRAAEAAIAAGGRCPKGRASR